MGRINPNDPFLYFTAGTASKYKNGKKVPVEKIIYNDPHCNYFIHPDGYVVLPDFNPVSGDIDRKVALMIIDGSVTVMSLSQAETTICNYKTNTAVSATSVSISGCLSSTDLEEAATRQLTATVLPSGAIQTGTWTSSTPSVATVSSTGLVTGVLEGTTTITFTSTDGGFTATCVITVIEA
jgi:uncharacterized protein YjdB